MKKIVILCVVLSQLSACQIAPANVTYVNGVPEARKDIDALYVYKFRFLERWRISFSWYDYPFSLHEKHGCHFVNNRFKKVPGMEMLAQDEFGPLLQSHTTVVQPLTLSKDGKNVIFGIGGHVDNDGPGVDPNDHDMYTLGDYLNDGTFRGFEPFCSDAFISGQAGANLMIVRTDPAKGTDEWFEHTDPVMVNGLHWFVRRGWDAPRNKYDVLTLESWVMRIPDTPYLLKMDFNSWEKGGPEAQSERFNKLLSMFHDIVASVTLEPIMPLVDQDKLFLPEKCYRSQPKSTAMCEFNRASLLTK